MESLLDKLIGFIAITIGVLFGHAGMWSYVAALISTIVSTIVFFAVLAIAIPFAKSQRLGGWARRIGKAVLSVQAVIASGVIAVIVAGIASIKWEVPLETGLLAPFFASLLLLGWGIVKLGKKKDTEQNIRQVSSEAAPSATPDEPSM
jgi:hypothetical protein